MTYDCKFEWWLAGAAVIVLGALLLGGNYWIGGPVLLILTIGAYPQSYDVSAEGLVVRGFLSRVTIPYRVITYVGPERGRVRIRYGLCSSVLIAPAQRQRFLDDVASRTPHLIRRGPSLVLSFA
ncbi:MAG TPA: hypothetical protein VN736_23500 [Candidatus Limnocylindrales bacterium]|nr:hypothetical protein [Candidatus Limnocylindrales bacterium]